VWKLNTVKKNIIRCETNTACVFCVPSCVLVVIIARVTLNQHDRSSVPRAILTTSTQQGTQRVGIQL
jgi:hypothetical protein